MDIYTLTGLVSLAALVFCIAAFGWRWRNVQRLAPPRDLSRPKGEAGRGILYAFTLGMMPWAKESTRRHWVAYMRGIAFHVGIFAGLAALLASPWFTAIPFLIRALFGVVTGVGAVMGVAGGIMRITEHNLRAVSTPDDHTSVWLVSLFLAAMTAALIQLAFVPFMWITAAAMLLYAPLSKIRHCLFFYMGRLFYGLHIGRRGIVKGLEGAHGK